MITLSYASFALYCYGAATVGFCWGHAQELLEEWAGFKSSWKRLVFPVLVLAWLPVVTVINPILNRFWAAREKRRRAAIKPQPLDLE